ncbi:hypothetical protein [Aromatoleum buckelii]|uniref:Mandelate racemase n=1 Tax=Aromatoleum buckelii TaxID=200254 RepID=A0ABX1N224_9RHOO|nr:hypothetical protein [Aromatoleum buckelii]MCK0509866.1 hypothetical protein [Aromatoleum buckelii]
MALVDSTAPIESVTVASYTIPTDGPESDGTLEWDATTLVVAHVTGGRRTGLGYGYTDTATARLIHDRLAPLLHGRDALATNARWQDMAVAIGDGAPDPVDGRLAPADDRPGFGLVFKEQDARCFENP